MSNFEVTPDTVQNQQWHFGMEQNSEEWVMHRMDYLNASEAPIAAGVAPSWFSINSPRKLWEFKNGEWQPEEDAFAERNYGHGHNFEAAARAKCDEFLRDALGKAALTLEPAVVTATVGGLPLSASLDGYVQLPDGRRIGAEIKCPATGLKSKTWRQIVEGEIQAYHEWQMDQQLVVGMLDELYFAVFVDEDNFKIIRYATPDPFRIVPMWKDWNDNPPEPEWHELPPELHQAATDYVDAKAAKEKAEAAMAAAKKEITAHGEKVGNLKGQGLITKKKTRKGDVQYAKVPELKGVDLDQYRGKESTYWEVRES